MRTAVTDFYRDNYGIEPPEQLEDLLQLRKQLELVNKGKPKSGRVAPDRNKSPIKECVNNKRKNKFKRLTAGDNHFSSDAVNSTVSANCMTGNLSKNRKNLNDRQVSQSIINLHQPDKSPAHVQKPSQKSGSNGPRAPVLRKDRTETKSAMDKTDIVECHITPRLLKKNIRTAELLPVKPLIDYQAQLSEADGLPNNLNVPLSKAQLQKKLLERRKQWR